MLLVPDERSEPYLYIAKAMSRLYLKLRNSCDLVAPRNDQLHVVVHYIGISAFHFTGSRRRVTHRGLTP